LMMLSTQVLPASLRYQGELAGIVTASRDNSIQCDRSAARLGDVARLSELLQVSIEEVQRLVTTEHSSTGKHADFIRDSLLPEMSVARIIADQLEELVPEDMWPLPSYTEMLFIR
jgi:glutamine synthetase